MEQKLGRQTAVIAVLAAAAAAFFLRRSQLQSGGALFSWFSVAMILVFAVYSGFLQPKKDYQVLAERSPVFVIGLFLAALGMLAGSFAMAMELERQVDLLLAAGGVVTAICYMVIAMDHQKDRRTPPMLYMVPALFYAIKLICDFRDWSRDPMILDYCFDLLALISVMCATYHLGGFCFDKGHRRMTVFFCLCGIFFGAAAIANGRVRELAMTGGGMIWLLCSVWPVLRVSRKPRAAEAEEKTE